MKNVLLASTIIASAMCVTPLSPLMAQQVPPATQLPDRATQSGPLRDENRPPDKPISIPKDIIQKQDVEGATGDEAARFTLSGFRYQGNSLFDKAALDAELAGYIGREVSLSELYTAARQVTALYGAEGRLLLPVADCVDSVF